MKPSACSTSSTLMRSFEFGDLIFAVPRSCPLRMRARRSPTGSVIAISLYPSLPACLGHARDQAEIRQIAQRDTRHAYLAVIALRAARHFATVMDAHLRGVARQFRELELRGETVFGGHFHVLRRRLQRRAFGCELRDHLHAFV